MSSATLRATFNEDIKTMQQAWDSLMPIFKDAVDNNEISNDRLYFKEYTGLKVKQALQNVFISYTEESSPQIRAPEMTIALEKTENTIELSVFRQDFRKGIWSDVQAAILRRGYAHQNLRKLVKGQAENSDSYEGAWKNLPIHDLEFHEID